MAEETEAYNASQIANGKSILEFSGVLYKETDEAILLTDILADLMHYCISTEIDFDKQLRIARGHVKTEEAEAAEAALVVVAKKRKTLQD